MMDNILEAIKKARIEAIKQGIRANAIIISPEFHYIKEFIVSENGRYNSLMPPMLCGMKAYIDSSGETPEEYAFAIVDSDPPATNEDRIREKVIEELRLLSVDELIKRVYGVDLREEENAE